MREGSGIYSGETLAAAQVYNSASMKRAVEKLIKDNLIYTFDILNIMNRIIMLLYLLHYRFQTAAALSASQVRTMRLSPCVNETSLQIAHLTLSGTCVPITLPLTVNVTDPALQNPHTVTAELVVSVKREPTKCSIGSGFQFAL